MNRYYTKVCYQFLGLPVNSKRHRNLLELRRRTYCVHHSLANYWYENKTVVYAADRMVYIYHQWCIRCSQKKACCDYIGVIKSCYAGSRVNPDWGLVEICESCRQGRFPWIIQYLNIFFFTFVHHETILHSNLSISGSFRIKYQKKSPIIGGVKKSHTLHSSIYWGARDVWI